MGISVERLKAINKKLQSKIKEKKDKIIDSDVDVTIDTEFLIENSIENVNKKLLNKIPQNLVKVIEIDETSDRVRLENMVKLLELYEKLEINKKAPNIENLFIYKAMNISGVGLKEEDFGEIRVGKYVQIIAITYEPDKTGKKKAKNISLGYYGKAETLDEKFKNSIIEFVLRWRYEKAFQNLKHYQTLISKVE